LSIAATLSKPLEVCAQLYSEQACAAWTSADSSVGPGRESLLKKDCCMIDHDRRTLHIRCGSDIRDKLTTAGFTGDFLEYADPVCEGPVPNAPDLTNIRARYLARTYGTAKSLTEAQIAAHLQTEDRRLTEAHRYDCVVLWFEHDSYDQLVLARILSRLAEKPIPTCLELICTDHHPEVPRFNGLGQLEPEALAALSPTRTQVTPDQLTLGQAIWSALRQSGPTAVQTLARTGTPALPITARALWRHLQEPPGTHRRTVADPAPHPDDPRRRPHPHRPGFRRSGERARTPGLAGRYRRAGNGRDHGPNQPAGADDRARRPTIPTLGNNHRDRTQRARRNR
jgi:hypothetical protein